MSTLYENIAGWMWQHKSLSMKPTTYDRLETSLRMLAKVSACGHWDRVDPHGRSAGLHSSE